MTTEQLTYYRKTKLNAPINVTFSFLLMTILVLTGCDCVQSVDGIIVDRQTKAPIEGANISKVEISKNTVTGEIEHSAKNGEFKFRRISGGIRHCPDLTLYFFKWGYKQTVLTFESGVNNDTIYLEKN